VFKARGLAGNLLRGGITALAFVFGAMCVTPYPDPAILLVATVFWFQDAASNIVGTIRDVDGDREGGYVTFAVRRGPRAALAVVVALVGCWVVVAALAPAVLPGTTGTAFYAPMIVLAVVLVAVALTPLRAGVDPVRALRAHGVLVVERTILAGAFTALGAGPALAVPVTVLALTVTLTAHRAMRSRYEFGAASTAMPTDVVTASMVTASTAPTTSTAAASPATAPTATAPELLDREAVFEYIDTQLAALAGRRLSSLRRWERRIDVELTDPATRITLTVSDGAVRRVPYREGPVLPTITIRTTGETFRDIFLLGRSHPRRAYLSGTITMDASPRDMFHINQLFNEFRRATASGAAGRPEAVAVERLPPPKGTPPPLVAAGDAACHGEGMPGVVFDSEETPPPRITAGGDTFRDGERTPKAVFGSEGTLPPQVVISDTTLRDGEQMPGVAFTPEEKADLARRLAALGVALIEAGYPAVSDEEAQAVRAIVDIGLDAAVQVIARPVAADIRAAADSGAHSIALFVGTSDAHVRAKLRTTRERLLTQVADAVALAKRSGRNVVFAAEDATRTDPEFLVRVYLAAADAGADALGLADTAGVATPWLLAGLVRHVAAECPLPIAVHCHNDLGLATANSLAGLLAGASGVQCSVLGVGERAGNAPLEEVVMALETLYDHRTGIDLPALTPLAHHVAALAGQPVTAVKPVVGGHAFVHESGLHVDGVVRDPSTYEPYPPELIGRERSFVFGKHSGRTALRHVLDTHAVDLGEPQLANLLAAVKRGRSTALLDEHAVVEMARTLQMKGQP
jgi:isopropylmalate/homocitrate/citramalate synthase